jgi:tryptophan 2,3-dioxygenase
MTRTTPPSGPGRIESPIVPAPGAVTYGSYLKIHPLLELQTPLSDPPQHDETLFIIIHQVYELWFKQILHEVEAAAEALAADQTMAFIRIAKRISTIQSVLTHQVDVLETMTPVDFNRFREQLNPASGFQSYQFRLLEMRLGAKDAAVLRFHRADALATAALERALAVPTLYDQFLRLLARRGFAVPREVLERDARAPYEATDAVREAILAVYRQADRFYDLYSTLEALIDLDEGLLLWRYRHVAMVERMIGTRKGTGGSSGVKYLSQTLAKRFFPEIWDARNWLGGSTGYGDRLHSGSSAVEGQQGHS